MESILSIIESIISAIEEATSNDVEFFETYAERINMSSPDSDYYNALVAMFGTYYEYASEKLMIIVDSENLIQIDSDNIKVSKTLIDDYHKLFNNSELHKAPFAYDDFNMFCTASKENIN